MAHLVSSDRELLVVSVVQSDSTQNASNTSRCAIRVIGFDVTPGTGISSVRGCHPNPDSRVALLERAYLTSMCAGNQVMPLPSAAGAAARARALASSTSVSTYGNASGN